MKEKRREGKAGEGGEVMEGRGRGEGTVNLTFS